MWHICKTCTWFIILILFISVGQSCNIINPKERVPTYIHIDSFQFTGLGSSEITSVTVFYNNNPIGSFDLPVTFPVMAEGSGKLLFAPCINSNGQNDRLVQYPFYRQDTFSFDAKPGAIITYNPKTNYVPAAKFLMISDFEYGQINMSKANGNRGISVVTDPSMIFEGNGSGTIVLNAVGDSSVDSSNSAFAIPAGETFVEFDYKTSIPFAVGFLDNYSSLYVGNQYYIAGVSPSDRWRKFYLNVTGYRSVYSAASYNFFLKTFLLDGQTSGRLLIDNIKLVTF